MQLEVNTGEQQLGSPATRPVAAQYTPPALEGGGWSCQLTRKDMHDTIVAVLQQEGPVTPSIYMLRSYVTG